MGSEGRSVAFLLDLVCCHLSVKYVLLIVTIFYTHNKFKSISQTTAKIKEEDNLIISSFALEAFPRLPPTVCLLWQVDQSGLFLPSRDYYLNKTADDKVRLWDLPFDDDWETNGWTGD